MQTKRFADIPNPMTATERMPLDLAIESRIESLTTWIEKNALACVEEQAHLDTNTKERAYWNYGYLIALRDVKELLMNGRRGLS